MESVLARGVAKELGRRGDILEAAQVFPAKFRFPRWHVGGRTHVVAGTKTSMERLRETAGWGRGVSQLFD